MISTINRVSPTIHHKSSRNQLSSDQHIAELSQQQTPTEVSSAEDYTNIDANNDANIDDMSSSEMSAKNVDNSGEHKNHKNLGTYIIAVITAFRPHQWIKNFLVIAAPMAALGTKEGQEHANIHMWLNVLIAFWAFCLAASSIYMINDIQDRQADRAHPIKKYRPIASGLVGPVAAYFFAAIAIGLAELLSLLVSPQLCLVIMCYFIIQCGYCFGLKHQAVIDIAIVSSGFLMRAIAGGIAAGVTLSRWFLLVMAFGSLFMAAGKRYAELHLAEQTGAKIRRSLQYYTMSYLRFVWTLAATAVVICYGMWAFDASHPNNSWYALSMAPFTIAILRYAIDIDSAVAGAPEEIAVKDRILQVLAILWIACIGLAVCCS